MKVIKIRTPEMKQASTKRCLQLTTHFSFVAVIQNLNRHTLYALKEKINGVGKVGRVTKFCLQIDWQVNWHSEEEKKNQLFGGLLESMVFLNSKKNHHRGFSNPRHKWDVLVREKLCTSLAAYSVDEQKQFRM